MRSLFSSVCYRSLTVITGQIQGIYIYILLRHTHFLYLYKTNQYQSACSIMFSTLLDPTLTWFLFVSFQSAKTPHTCVQPQGSELQQDAQPDLRSSTPKEYEAPFSLRRWLGQFSESISIDPRVSGIGTYLLPRYLPPIFPAFFFGFHGRHFSQFWRVKGLEKSSNIAFRRIQVITESTSGTDFFPVFVKDTSKQTTPLLKESFLFFGSGSLKTKTKCGWVTSLGEIQLDQGAKK